MATSFIALFLQPSQIQRRRQICTCTSQSSTPKNPGSGNSKSNRGSGGGVPTPPENTVTSPQSAKDRLLKLLPALINIPAQSAKVATLIGIVESGLQPPVTAAFTELATTGSWRLLFSSALPVRANPSSIRIRTITQIIRDNSLVNEITVTWEPQKDAKVEATLRVNCKYKFVGAARMHVELIRHTMNIDSRNDLAKNLPSEYLEPMVHELQRALPCEIFDPSGLIDTTAVGPDFRISRFIGKRLAGVRNVFVPVDSPVRFPVK